MLRTGSLILAGLAGCQACNPIWGLRTVEVSGVGPSYARSHTSSEVKVDLKQSYSPTRAGLELRSSSGKPVATGPCTVAQRASWLFSQSTELTCRLPEMEPGKYEVFFAPDVSCGASAFSDTGVLFEVIEPAHIQRMEPAEGLEQAETTITLVGSNIGGPRVYCDLHWLKADGAKWGCEMTVDSAPAVNWTSTSAVCVVPKWPGPLTQYDGKGGFHPLEGAECGRKVRVQLTNDAKVESEPIIFRYAEVPKSAIVV